MKTFLLLLSLVLAMVLPAQKPANKQPLDITLINYAELTKLNQSDPSQSAKKKLTAFQYVDFAGKWNASTSIGADKYKISYYIIIYFYDGSKRQFTIGGSKVQEANWMTMDFGDKDYFDGVWKVLK